MVGADIVLQYSSPGVLFSFPPTIGSFWFHAAIGACTLKTLHTVAATLLSNPVVHVPSTHLAGTDFPNLYFGHLFETGGPTLF